MCVPVLKCHQFQGASPWPPTGPLDPAGGSAPDPRYRLALPRSPYCGAHPSIIFCRRHWSQCHTHTVTVSHTLSRCHTHTVTVSHTLSRCHTHTVSRCGSLNCEQVNATGVEVEFRLVVNQRPHVRHKELLRSLLFHVAELELRKFLTQNNTICTAISGEANETSCIWHCATFHCIQIQAKQNIVFNNLT